MGSYTTIILHQIKKHTVDLVALQVLCPQGQSAIEEATLKNPMANAVAAASSRAKCQNNKRLVDGDNHRTKPLSTASRSRSPLAPHTGRSWLLPGWQPTWPTATK